ncbi:hypothetical protein VTL71DRAFT_11419 [Oculimacula yallundae]|uniref:Uncharacterized protein n=1 Tax=Oculimacula yallundae TaxID=86028 RepID=A0ABR4CS99_9HELO
MTNYVYIEKAYTKLIKA